MFAEMIGNSVTVRVQQVGEDYFVNLAGAMLEIPARFFRTELAVSKRLSSFAYRVDVGQGYAVF